MQKHRPSGGPPGLANVSVPFAKPFSVEISAARDKGSRGLGSWSKKGCGLPFVGKNASVFCSSCCFVAT